MGMVRRLKHRYITLGTKGKEYLLENGFEVREHCRNENNIERLNVISDIASCLIHDNMYFIPSWNMKKEDEEDITDEDMDKLIEMYEKETEELNKETEYIKIHISQMLKELKQ